MTKEQANEILRLAKETTRLFVLYALEMADASQCVRATTQFERAVQLATDKEGNK